MATTFIELDRHSFIDGILFIIHIIFFHISDICLGAFVGRGMKVVI